MKENEASAPWQTLTTIRSRLNDTVLRRDSLELVSGNYDTDSHPAAHEPNQIGFATQGFENFHFEVPDDLRGKTATLRFELEGNTPIYLDDVFFQSVHLKLGNPTLTDPADGANQQKARFDVAQPNNYLIEKPQYVLSYNNRERGPNWVSYQLNNSWIGAQERRQNEAWDRDFQLLPPLEGTQGQWYTGTGRQIHRGHMTTRSHRNRNLKDQQSTFYTSSMLPQHAHNNSDSFQSAWYNLEGYARDQLVLTEGKELYIISGGFGSAPLPNNPPIPANHPLRVNGINYPEATWKVIVVLEPGQGVADITEDTRVIGVITPNNARPTDLTPEQLEAWRNWGEWRFSVDDIESVTGLNLLSNIPEEIQDQIEERVDNGPTERTGVVS
ncbi:DNA/RNA non-specific endonuclease [Okeania sp.]|uniref:DNA/RNA non-specific endonuclease n=1 Tax=Okeania sp. TaxID=3100323 RepID=UPI002B4B6E5F|nr:DNA/RNA non-specific endonuclease [Okeania sp.]MEB3341216.1 DNA/RNA non-specific endonuclease [Okeania sp.]